MKLVHSDLLWLNHLNYFSCNLYSDSVMPLYICYEFSSFQLLIFIPLFKLNFIIGNIPAVRMGGCNDHIP